jgi:hypothetical protein
LYELHCAKINRTPVNILITKERNNQTKGGGMKTRKKVKK